MEKGEAADGPRAKIVLHQSTPLRRKSTSQMRQDRERFKQYKNRSTERIVQQNLGSNTCRETAMNAQIRGDDSPLHSHSYLHKVRDRTNQYTAREQSQRFVTTKQIVVTMNTTEMSNSILIRLLQKSTMEEEETRINESNKVTDLSNSHDDQAKASMSQHSIDTKSSFYTPEGRTRADSAGSDQKYSHKPRLSSSVTLNTDHSEDELSDDTNESQHSELGETEKNISTQYP